MKNVIHLLNVIHQKFAFLNNGIMTTTKIQNIFRYYIRVYFHQLYEYPDLVQFG